MGSISPLTRAWLRCHLALGPLCPGVVRRVRALGGPARAPTRRGLGGAAGGLARRLRERWEEAERMAERQLLAVGKAGACVVGVDDPGYPTPLRWTDDPPPVLFVRGEWTDGDVLAAAIVGARRASRDGRLVARQIAGEVAGRGLTVVSGLARGIDAAAHRGALEAGGRTIAVLGSGLDAVYPGEHRPLADEAARSGAVVTEYPMGWRPIPASFPRRNRIIAGLSLGVVVVEAAGRSGSLSTARMALEQGREVMAVPGIARAERTEGTNGLLRQGARLVESGEDVVAEIAPWLTDERSRGNGDGSDEEPPGETGAVLRVMDGPTGPDELAERTGVPVARILDILTELEIEGVVRRTPGMLYTKR